MGLTIGVIAVAMITLSTVSNLDFIVMGALKCTSDFWTRTCCWDDLDEDGNVVTKCYTCIDNGRGGCVKGSGQTTTTNKPADPFTPAPGGIFQGDIIPTPGPAAQE